MSNFAWWYYTLTFTCSLHFQWPWHYFKVTAVSKSFNKNFYVLIQLSWNFKELLSMLSRSWMYRYSWLSHTFKGDNWHVSRFNKNLSENLKLRIIITLLGVYQFIPGLMTLTLFQGHGYVWIINCKLIFRFLSIVV